jgi:hypothetical protein
MKALWNLNRLVRPADGTSSAAAIRAADQYLDEHFRNNRTFMQRSGDLGISQRHPE